MPRSRLSEMKPQIQACALQVFGNNLATAEDDLERLLKMFNGYVAIPYMDLRDMGRDTGPSR
jgi:hypothetical protein